MENNKIFTINITGEARKLRDEMLARDSTRYLKKEGFHESLKGLKDVQAQILPEANIKNTLEEELVDGFKVYSFSKPEYENVVLYVHGGGWVYEIFPEHIRLCDDLVDVLNAKVYAPLYPLAPKYSYKDTYKMIVDLYDMLIATGKPLFVIGDSAGGNIVLGLMHIIAETGRKKPDRLVSLSPCVDMTISNPDAMKVEALDPYDAVYGIREFGKMWANGTDAKDSLLSPLFSDVSQYSKTMLLAASNDILTPDILKFHKKLVDAGVDVTLVKGEGLFHVFPSVDIPERAEFLDILKNFCKNAKTT